VASFSSHSSHLTLLGSILELVVKDDTTPTVKQLVGRSSIPFNGISNGDRHFGHLTSLLVAAARRESKDRMNSLHPFEHSNEQYYIWDPCQRFGNVRLLTLKTGRVEARQRLDGLPHPFITRAAGPNGLHFLTLQGEIGERRKEERRKKKKGGGEDEKNHDISYFKFSSLSPVSVFCHSDPTQPNPTHPATL